MIEVVMPDSIRHPWIAEPAPDLIRGQARNDNP